jgi:Flp pilus assembly pilin Flp
MINKLVHLLRDDKGQDLIEYGLLGAFISIVSLVTIRAFGPIISSLYEGIEAVLTVGLMGGAGVGPHMWL